MGPFDECKYWPIFKINDSAGWNDVWIIEFAPTNYCNEDELQDTMVATLKELVKRISKNVVVGSIGVYTINDDVDKYYLVQWVERP